MLPASPLTFRYATLLESHACGADLPGALEHEFMAATSGGARDPAYNVTFADMPLGIDSEAVRQSATPMRMLSQGNR
jgi:hypothetical protein